MLCHHVLMYVITNYQRGSLTELSEYLYQPDYKICKLIKCKLGKTFKQLVQEVRLDKAMWFLKSTDIPVEQIIMEVGYENETYFYRIFKLRFGASPKEYRKKKNNKHSYDYKKC